MRKTFLTGYIDEESCSEVIKDILELMQEGSSEPILLFIDSNGGSLNAAMGLIGFIESIPVEIWTVALGSVFSAAFIIYLIGEKRLTTAYSSFMIHEVSTGAEGDILSVEKGIEHTKLIRNQMHDFLIKSGHFSKDFLENLKHDYYFTAEETLKNGVSTGIFEVEIKEEEEE